MSRSDDNGAELTERPPARRLRTPLGSLTEHTANEEVA
jgi:hypothetical protein